MEKQTALMQEFKDLIKLALSEAQEAFAKNDMETAQFFHEEALELISLFEEQGGIFLQ